LLEATVGTQQVKTRVELLDEAAGKQGLALAGLEHLYLGLSVDQPAAIEPQPQVAQSTPGRFNSDPSSLLDLKPERLLLEVSQPICYRLELDNLGAWCRVNLDKGVDRKKGLALRNLMPDGDDLVLTVVQEEIDATILLSCYPAHRTGAGHAIHELQGHPLFAVDGNRIAPKTFDRKHCLVPASSWY
jgi:hypothetical protein